MYTDNSKVKDVDIDKEMRKSFLEYSMSVIVARALPDVRDGMKPVHRRIIYTMNDAGNTADKPYRKCAYTVGEVLGKYHPHGIFAIWSREIVKSTVLQPRRAEASAASTPACPAPTTATSNSPI